MVITMKTITLTCIVLLQESTTCYNGSMTWAYLYSGLFTEGIELQNGNSCRRIEEGDEVDVERDNLQLWLWLECDRLIDEGHSGGWKFWNI